MTHLTQILNAIDAGDPQAADQLLPLVYDELRKLAAEKLAGERPGQTFQATALVHEAYLRLVGDQHFDSRRHFFAAAAEAMRRILVEKARRRKALKHGGERQQVALEPDECAVPLSADPSELLALHEILDELADLSPRKAQLVKLRYFLGCTMPESAEILGIAQKTAEEDWTFARAWLRRQWLKEEEK